MWLKKSPENEILEIPKALGCLYKQWNTAQKRNITDGNKSMKIKRSTKRRV